MSNNFKINNFATSSIENIITNSITSTDFRLSSYLNDPSTSAGEIGDIKLQINSDTTTYKIWVCVSSGIAGNAIWKYTTLS